MKINLLYGSVSTIESISVLANKEIRYEHQRPINEICSKSHHAVGSSGMEARDSAQGRVMTFRARNPAPADLDKIHDVVWIDHRAKEERESAQGRV